MVGHFARKRTIVGKKNTNELKFEIRSEVKKEEKDEDRRRDDKQSSQNNGSRGETIIRGLYG